MSATERSWTEWFTWHLNQAPFQLMHMRELARTTIAAQDTTAVRVDGGRDTAPLPYRVDPADDADLLWSTLVLFGREVSEKIGGSSPRALRAGNWNGPTEVQGLPSCTPSEAFALAAEVTRWLIACAHEIAHDPDLHDAPDQLADVIRQMRSRYPRAEPKFKAYRPHPCPTCGERTIGPIWGENGLDGLRCDNCEKTWGRDGQPIETKFRIHDREP